MPTTDRDVHDRAYFRYRLYGRVCASAIELPELEDAGDEAPDFVIERGATGTPTPGSTVESIGAWHRRPWMSVARSDSTAWLWFARGARFRATSVGGPVVRVVAEPERGTPELTVRHFLIDEVIPYLIAQTGVVVMHGAAIRIGDGALVLVSESGHGKSTLAASFAQRGYPVLADDCVVIDRADGTFLAQPSYPSVRLWDRSARALFGGTTRGRAFAHYSEKRRYSQGLSFSAVGAPVHAVAVLDWPEGRLPERASIGELRGHDACAEVLRGVLVLPQGPVQRTIAGQVLDLTAAARVARVQAPSDLRQVAATRDAILGWVNR